MFFITPCFENYCKSLMNVFKATPLIRSPPFLRYALVKNQDLQLNMRVTAPVPDVAAITCECRNLVVLAN